MNDHPVLAAIDGTYDTVVGRYPLDTRERDVAATAWWAARDAARKIVLGF